MGNGTPEKEINIKCPYICLSIEPGRIIPPSNLALPLCEFNAIAKTTFNTKTTAEPYSEILFNKYIFDISFRSSGIINFDEIVKTFWIPYIAFHYIGSVPYDTETNLYVSNLNLVNKKTNFMYIVSNCNNSIRERIFSALQQKLGTTINNQLYNNVYSFGLCQPTSSLYKEGNFRNKYTDKEFLLQTTGTSLNRNTSWIWQYNMDLFSKSKFGFAIENCLLPGYITEKIMLVYQGNCIPIYWGPPEIKNIFNIETFYYVNDKLRDHTKIPGSNREQIFTEDVNLIIDELTALADDEGPTGWRKFLGKPIYKNNMIPDIINYKNAQWTKDIIKYIQETYPIAASTTTSIAASTTTSIATSTTTSIAASTTTSIATPSPIVVGEYKKYLKYKQKYLQLKKLFGK